MSCETFRPALRDHAAGTAPSPDLTAHLRACPACAKALAAEVSLLEEVDAIVGELGRLEPSLESLAHARSLTARRYRSFRLPAAWAAVAACFVLGLIHPWLRPTAVDDQPPTTSATSVPSAPSLPPATPSQTPRCLGSPRLRRMLPLPEVVVVVPPDQEQAFLRYAELLATDGVTMPPQLIDPAARAATITEPPDLDTPLLNIEPIGAEEAPSEE